MAEYQVQLEPQPSVQRREQSPRPVALRERTVYARPCRIILGQPDNQRQEIQLPELEDILPRQYRRPLLIQPHRRFMRENRPLADLQQLDLRNQQHPQQNLRVPVRGYQQRQARLQRRPA